jgi:hypothetical protein
MEKVTLPHGDGPSHAYPEDARVVVPTRLLLDDGRTHCIYRLRHPISFWQRVPQGLKATQSRKHLEGVLECFKVGLFVNSVSAW